MPRPRPTPAPVKILISLDLQPLLYAWPKFLHADLQTATEENVVSTLVRHRPRAGGYLAKIFYRPEKLALVFVIRVEHQNDFAIPIARSPNKIILVPGYRRWQAELWAEKIDRASFAVVLAKNRGAFLILRLEVMIDMRY